MRHWFDQAIIYQLYPKSFQDSNGDGIGDLNGIIQRIPYLQALGINCVWLNPVFTSPQVDNGYDVANYYAIDETMGTMADMTALITALHQAGIKLVLDFVLNHTSDQHPWFQDALRDPHSLYRDYYLFAGKDNLPPNNWGSFFGGSVWTPDPNGSGQSYLHLFDSRMPDLNWANPEVRHAMQDVAEFWLQKGIDGLRLDAFIHIAKADLAQAYPAVAPHPVAEPFFANRPQVQTWLRPLVAQLKADFPEAFLLGEAASATVDLAQAYTTDLMDAVVSFRYFPEAPSEPKLPASFQPKVMDWLAFKQNQVVWQQTLTAPPTLYWSNHDMSRLRSRLAQSDSHAQSLAMLMYLQRGIPIIYYGEELGMQNLTFDTVAAFDDETVATFVQAAVAAGYSQKAALAMVSANHKLPARAPMPWDERVNGGFTSGTPWLSGQAQATTSAVQQAQDPGSMLAFYQQLLGLKKQRLFQDGAYRMLDHGADSYVYQRQNQDATAIVAVALGKKPVTIPLKGLYRPLLTSGDYDLQADAVNLQPEAGVVLIQEGGNL